MNVILIILDALRYDHVNSENTPNLMELAKKGVFFTNATSCNSSTIVSLPYILCGKKDYDSEKNIASILFNAGVHTAMIHSNPILHKFYPGFEDSIDLKSNKIRLDKRWKKLIRNNLPSNLINRMKKVRAALYEDDKYLPYSRAGETLEFSRNWMNDHEDYFLWIHIMEPHIPYYPLRTSLKLTRHDMRILNDKLIESVYKNYQPTNEEIEQANKLYSEEIKEMDEELGNFFKVLNSDDLLVITSDHGEEFGEHGQFSHHENKMVPELIHVPLIFYGKDVKKGLVVNKQIYTSSIGQTILNSLKIDNKLGESLSIWSIIKN